MPEEFSVYLNYCRNLKFEEKPDYGYLRKLFKDLMHQSGFENDYNYDWVIKKSGGKVPEPVQRVEPEKKNVEERKENRMLMGQQVVGGFKEERKTPY